MEKLIKFVIVAALLFAAGALIEAALGLTAYGPAIVAVIRDIAIGWLVCDKLYNALNA